MSNVNKQREFVHTNALNNWIENKKIGTVEVATGLGKTWIALKALYTMDVDDRIHLFLAETKGRKHTLMKEIVKFNAVFNCDVFTDYNLNFHCYQEVCKWENKEFGLVIGDEIHDGLTPEYSKFFSKNDYEAVIGLSALVDVETSYEVDRGVMKNIIVTKGMYLSQFCPIVYSYTLGEARKNNLSRNLKIHLIKHQLDSVHKTVPYSKKSKYKQTELKAYNYWSERKLKVLEEEKDISKRILVSKMIVNKQCTLLYNLPSKVIAIKRLLTLLDRTIIFGNSIDALLKITPYVVSSRFSDKKNNSLVNAFENDRIGQIASFKKLKQGENFSNLDNQIIHSYYSKEKDVIQRFGRLRLNGDKKGNVFIFITQGTFEVDWYTSMMSENIENSYEVITHNNIDECINYIKKQQE